MRFIELMQLLFLHKSLADLLEVGLFENDLEIVIGQELYIFVLALELNVGFEKEPLKQAA